MPLPSKAVCLGLAALALATATATSADARRRPRHDDEGHQTYRGDYRNSALIRSNDHDRAVNADPTGSYKAYPDWARFALGAGGGRR